ncbi:MAG: hypothetical protein ACRCXT_17870 [Paraclostridium sp.]
MLSQYDKDNMLLPIPDIFSNDPNKMTMFKINWSFLDVPNLPNTLAGRLNPLIKVPLEKLTGSNFFTHQSYTGGLLDGAQSELLGDSKGLKSFIDMGQKTDTSHLGVFGQRLNDIADPLFKLFGQKGGVQASSDLLPSVFRTSDMMQNKVYNLQKENQAIRI